MLRQTPLLLLFVIRIAFVSVGEGGHYAFGFAGRSFESLVVRQGSVIFRGQPFSYAVLVMLLVQDWENLSVSIGPTFPWSFALCILALAVGYKISRLLGIVFVDCANEGSVRNLAVAFLIATTVLCRLILPCHRVFTLWFC